MKLSVVATLYHSAPYIEEFCRQASEAAATVAGDDFEIVLVNDGSPDESLAEALRVRQQRQNVVVVDLSRNFGHHKAIMTGLAYAKGELIFLIDSDLEESPEWLLQFHEQFLVEHCDVVYGIQSRRKGGWIERWTGRWYYHVMSMLTDVVVPESVVTARLMTRRFVNALLQHDEREMFLGGLFALTGFEQRSSVVKKASTSETTYTLRRKIRLLVDSVTSFSNTPLVMIFNIGISIFLLSVCYIVFLTINWLLFSKPPSGWTSVMASIWLIGGLVISFLGVIGIYLAKIFSEAKRRPYSIVRQVYGRDSH